MTQDEIRRVCLCLISGVRAEPGAGKNLGEALLAWLEDSTGLPFEYFAGLAESAGSHRDLVVARNTICRDYAETLTGSISERASVILDQVSLCGAGIKNPQELGETFARFYFKLQHLRVDLPEHRQLRKILS